MLRRSTSVDVCFFINSVGRVLVCLLSNYGNFQILEIFDATELCSYRSFNLFYRVQSLINYLSKLVHSAKREVDILSSNSSNIFLIKFIADSKTRQFSSTWDLPSIKIVLLVAAVKTGYTGATAVGERTFKTIAITRKEYALA